MFGSLPHMPDQDYDNIYATTGLDADGRMKNFAAFNTQMELTIRAYAKFAKKVPGFSSLETQDQVTLIKCKGHFLYVWILVLHNNMCYLLPCSF